MELLLDIRRLEELRTLLLLYFFIGNVAADCPRPDNRDTMVLTDEALLLNDFPNGLEISFECSNGYEKESGSETIKCVDDNWTEPELICKKMDCGPPPAQEHMLFDTSHGTLFGSMARVMCEDGYQIHGSSYKHCYAHGWFGTSFCKIVTCGKPIEVKNGNHSWNSDANPKYGQMVNYTCDQGYKMVGEQSVLCTKTGEYDSLPECMKTSTAVVSTATPTSHRATPILTRQQDYRFLTSGGKAATTRIPSSASLEAQIIETIDINKNQGNAAVVVSVVVVTLVACIVIFSLHRFLLRRKGSYDTGEDLKPELLQFQTL